MLGGFLICCLSVLWLCVFYFGVSPVFSIHNGKWTEWRPIWSVIIGVLTKSDDREAGVHLFIMSMNTDKIGRHEVLLPSYQNYDKI